jgi:HD-like signal output (HDOD) protein
MPTTPAATPSLGAYALHELLGSSERSMVWRGTHLETGAEHFLCLPRKMPELRQALERWHEGVRLGSRREHPQLLPLAESSTSERWPYAAYPAEGVQLLSAHLAALTDPPTPREVVSWLCDVLQALAYLHDGGAAHHDLEAFNIGIDGLGRATLLGVGVACLWDGESAERGQGAQGGVQQSNVDALALWSQRGSAARDVLSAGTLLLGLLEGGDGSDDVSQLVRQIVQTPMLLQDTPHPVNQGLRAIVERATHANPRLRYATARAMLRALEGWRDVDDAAQTSFVQQLIDRCGRDGLLPARPGTQAHVYRVVEKPLLTIGELADAVAQDLSLSLELLRQVNTIEFRGLGGGPVIALSRAVALVGLKGVTEATRQLRLLPDNSPAVRPLARAVERAAFAGYLSEELLPEGMGSEVAVLAGTMHNLGRLAVAFHYPQESEQIVALMQPSAPGLNDAMDEQHAAAAVLGCDYAQLGQQLAQAWHVPHDLVAMMATFDAAGHVPRPEGVDAMLRLVANAANEVVDALAQPVTAQRQNALRRVLQRYGRHIDLDERRLQRCINQARLRASRSGPAGARARVREEDSLLTEPVPGKAAALSAAQDAVSGR